MAKDIVQATNNKGVAGWSLKTDDNATVDPTINWQEGQAPSTVNNSARAMMTRIREEHDLIFNTLENSWGSKFLYVEIGSYTLEDNKNGAFNLNMVLAKKLTDEQYADFQAGKLFLAVNWDGGIPNNPVYKTLTTQDIITLSLSIPTASTTHLWHPYVVLSFFGTWHETNRITLHELSYIINNLMGYVAEKTTPPSNSMRTVRSIPMHRSYIDYRIIKTTDIGSNELTIKISWYYISPCEIVLTVEPRGSIKADSDGTRIGYLTFGLANPDYDLKFTWDDLTLLDSTTREGVVYTGDGAEVPWFSIGSFSPGPHSVTINLPKRWDGVRYRFHAKLTTDAHFKLYPMNIIPEPGKTYPIIT